MKRTIFAAFIILALFRIPSNAATFTVVNTNATGPGSLQQAMLDANANPGPDTIAFNIASGGLTISPASPLPVVTDTVTIDGSTQPGYSSAPLVQISGALAGSAANGFVISASNCVIRALSITGFEGDDYYTGDAIQITNGVCNVVEGCYLGVAPDGVTPLGNAGAGVRIGNPSYYEYYEYGLVTSNNIIGGAAPGLGNLISANGYGIYVIDSSSNWIHGNYIGTDVSGSFEMGNTYAGVVLWDYYSAGNVIGGTNAADMNLISGNGGEEYYSADGVFLDGCQTNAVFGNFIGVDATGTYAIPNQRHGVDIQYGNNNLVGGAGAGQSNLISGNVVNGVNLGAPEEDIVSFNYQGTPAPSPYGNIIQGNLIGTDVSGHSPIPNQHDGVQIMDESGNLVGGYLPGEGNVIDYNTNDGVEITGYGEGDDNEVAGNVIYANQNTGVLVGYGSIQNTISSNSIFGNTNLGIDLDGDGVTLNDPGDTDFGGNELQNFPVLGFPLNYAGYTLLTGTLNSMADTNYTIEIFDNDYPDPSGYGQGQRFLTALSVVTDDSGNASFSTTNIPELPLSHWITATATDPFGNTSEFCLAREVVSPDSVDIAVTLSGGASPAPKSEPYDYSITVTNNGPANATDVVVTDPLPYGFAFDSATTTQGVCNFDGSVLTCAVGSLAPGAGAVITFEVTDYATGIITDTVSASADQTDNNPVNNSASLTTQFGIADIGVGAFNTPDPVTAGQSVTYTVTATNFGPDDSSGAILTFSMDPSLLITGSSVSQGSVSGGSYLFCYLGALPANATATLTVTAIPTQAGSIYNYVSGQAAEVDTNTDNNNFTEVTDVQAGPGVIQFTQPLYTVDENAGVVAITVQRTGGAIGPVSVNFTTTDQTAVAGTDYITTNGTLNFADGVSNAIFTVTILDNGETGCNKTLGLQLSSPTGGAVLTGTTSATLQIFNSHTEPAGLVQGVSLADAVLTTTGDGSSQTASISDDGRYIAFTSYANNLTATPISYGLLNVFVHDRQSDTTTLASPDVTGLEGANGYSGNSQISADGGAVGFISSANNLTTNSAAAQEQIYAHFLAMGTNELVSVNTNGTGPNDYSETFSISTNGTKFAFTSYATDLTTTNTGGVGNIFYRDLASRNVALVSVNSTGDGGGNDLSYAPTISGDGRYVAFGSYANNLLPADNNTRFDIYRRDTVAGVTELVSANTSGVAGNSSCGSDIYISDDGRYVAFESYDSDLAPGSVGYQAVYLRDMVAGTTQLVSVNNSGQSADSYCSVYGMSADGRYILFDSYANNLATNDNNNQPDLFLRDVVAGTTTLVTVNLSGTAPGNNSFDEAALSRNGRYVIFSSTSTDLVSASKTPGVDDEFVRDMVTQTTTLLTTAYGSSSGGNGGIVDMAISSTGVGAFSSYASDLAGSDDNQSSDVFARAPGEPALELISQGTGITGDSTTTYASVTADGSKVAFTSYSGDLVPGDTNGCSDVFLYDLTAHSMTLISANASNNGTPSGNSDSPSPSQDGHFVAYHNAPLNEPEVISAASIFGSAFDQIYLRDAISNVTTLVSSDWVNSAPANGASIDPQITPDGQYVVFQSSAGNLTSNGLDGVTEEIFIRNRTNSTCELVSANAGIPANDVSQYATVSADGRYVAFETFADNLGPVDNNNNSDVYVHDRLTGSNILCSPSLSGNNGGDDSSYGAFISADGSTVVFSSFATDLVPDGSSYTLNMFAFNLATRTVQLISVNTNGIPGNGNSAEPSVSANGRYVAFYSDSTDLAPGNYVAGNVFVRDLVAGTTTLASINCAGTDGGNNYSDTPQITPDGHYVAFFSYATDLVPGDFSLDDGSVFRRDLDAGTTVLVSQDYAFRGEANNTSFGASISGNGAVVAFLSYASDLIMGDNNGQIDAFAWTAGISGVDLAVTQTASAGSVAQGSALSYTLTVTNYGVTNATSVVLTDALPASLAFVSATISQGTFTNSGGALTFNLGTLNIGAGAQITVNVTATAAGQVTNTTTAGAAQSDYNLGNNSASTVVSVMGLMSPLLSVMTTNSSQLYLNWPYPSSGFNLETTTNLAVVLSWMPVTNAVNNNGLVNFVILNVNTLESQRYFRLHHP